LSWKRKLLRTKGRGILHFGLLLPGQVWQSCRVRSVIACRFVVCECRVSLLTCKQLKIGQSGRTKFGRTVLEFWNGTAQTTFNYLENHKTYCRNILSIKRTFIFSLYWYTLINFSRQYMFGESLSKCAQIHVYSFM
jgi:hypothetical protein